jgi:hypothetical protein
MPADTPNPEIALAITALLVAIAAAWFRVPGLGWWERPLGTLARRKKLLIVIAILAPLLLRALLLPLFPAPEPRVHDEFSFLLAADTFTHGRLVNPPHPFWVHFESVHILMRPVYASAFPIAQAMVLAAGKILGHPWIGVWISTGLMCGAICWMLQGWLPPRWALFGTLLAILHFGVSSYWMNSYWGGSVAACGGALVLGALPRIMRAPRWRCAAVMGVGLVVLSQSRPFEGAVFSLVVAVPLFTWMLGRNRPQVRVTLRQVILPLTLILAIAGIGTMYYFSRVTGKPWVAPYILYRTTKTVAPHFIFQKPRPAPLYDNRELRNFYVYSEIQNYLTARNAPIEDLHEKMGAYWRFYGGPLLTIPLLALPFAFRRDRLIRLTFWMAAGFSLALVFQVWHNPHYGAPATGLVILMVVLCARRLRLWRWKKLAIGRCLVRWLPVACVSMLAIQIFSLRLTDLGPRPASWRWPGPGGVARAKILSQLARSGEKHLVFVRYEASHDTGNEWVYNDADIDGSPVVWARELDRGSNAKLMEYFKGRRVWLAEPDKPPMHLLAYNDAPPRAMPFVQIGAPGIEVLRSAEGVKRLVLETDSTHGQTRYTCDGWNFIFTEATGVAGPPVAKECYAGGDRSGPVSFEQWFTWLVQQR